MKVLLLGSGGREHALAWKMAQSPQCEQLFIAPGNPGTAELGENIDLSPANFEAVTAFCKEKEIDMLVVGPEDPLVNGVTDHMEAHLPKLKVIGPTAAGAQLEGSKDFAKQFMQQYNIPTAAYKTFNATQLEEGLAYLNNHAMPVVLKADGLAAGKGVLICATHEEATEALKSMLDGQFGDASSRVVIEEFLDGTELTVIVLTDGEHYGILPPSKDYKRIGEGDTGLNTGGMGAVSPPPFATHDFMEKVERQVIQATIDGLNNNGVSYKGFIYFGLIQVNGEPYVIEYNCRMGDPETQVILPRLQNDLLELFNAVSVGELHMHPIKTDSRAAATVILASMGYPGKYDKGTVITGLEYLEDSIVFQAGTSLNSTNELITNGGRVLAVTAYGEDLSAALRGSYANTARIYFENRYFRRDIGWDVV